MRILFLYGVMMVLIYNVIPMGLVIKLSKNIRLSLLPLALILFTSNSPVIAESYQLFIIAGENNKGIFNPFETYK